MVSDIASYIFIYYQLYNDDVHNDFDARIFRGMYIFSSPQYFSFIYRCHEIVYSIYILNED